MKLLATEVMEEEEVGTHRKVDAEDAVVMILPPPPGERAAAGGGTTDGGGPDERGQVIRDRLVGEMGPDRLMPWVDPPLVVYVNSWKVDDKG